ncbi:hypothetical protein AAFF_G00196520 [Aldrovandia affinis]|uniref:Uncharacterized protein n=1 Tax=Aldrovandia affinis TaxID=143900 RepID=A0AAD7W5F8_9TELE|nr:hypothetical protein AAFF_G00196520 [Aldrovandia affinis]
MELQTAALRQQVAVLGDSREDCVSLLAQDDPGPGDSMSTFPDKEIGKTPLSSGNAFTSNSLLKGTLTALSLQAWLLNAASLLQRFQAKLIAHLPDGDPELADNLEQASILLSLR